ETMRAVANSVARRQAPPARLRPVMDMCFLQGDRNGHEGYRAEDLWTRVPLEIHRCLPPVKGPSGTLPGARNPARRPFAGPYMMRGAGSCPVIAREDGRRPQPRRPGRPPLLGGPPLSATHSLGTT